MLINELARQTGVSKDTIRHYQELGLLSVKKQQAGSRFYNSFPQQNIDRIETIKLGKSMGFSLREIASLLDAYFSGEVSAEQQIAIFEEKLGVIEQRIKDLQKTRTHITTKLAILRSA